MMADEKSAELADLLTADNLITPERTHITAFLILGP